MGNGRVEELSAIGGKTQSAISLMSDVDGTGPCSLLNSIICTPRNNDPVMSG